MITSTHSTMTIAVTIVFAALITYSLRFGGLMLAGKFPDSGRFKRFMDALPGTILISLVAPGIFLAGFWGGVGALVTALCAYKTKNAFLSMLLGVLIVAFQRQWQF